MRISGTADLPLHGGHVPPWLMERMKSLASAISSVIVEEYGQRELLRRLGDPLWFQSFGCVLGFDWHSSGLTTVVTGALREALRLEDHGVAVVGGKGRLSRRVPESILSMNLEEDTALRLLKVSRMTAKVDNAVLQDGYTIYHHVIIFTDDGEWTVIQQGMNEELGYARRYHWLGERVESFVVEPHSGLAGEKIEERVLNLVSRKSEEARKASVDLASEKLSRLMRLINMALNRQETLTRWLGGEALTIEAPKHLTMPRRINWKTLKKLYEVKPRNYEELVELRGLGPSTIRALALVAALVYGVEIDWRDPVKFTFAVGGKDGVPRPISKRTFDETIRFMQEVLEASEIEREEKKSALRRLFSLERRMYGP